MRIERSVMYKTPHRNDSLDRSTKTAQLKTRNLSNVRQHLFSRDSISSQDDICLAEESINLTDILEKFVTSCATLNTTISKSHSDKSHDDASNKSKMSITRMTKPSVESIEIQSEITTRQIDQCSIGGGDGPSIVETSKSYGDVSRLNHAAEVT
nr:uncharacterized protein LOC117230022 [Megalopta genalis]XP_033343018.1 uncharacterized protein LOC117230057 [Megalopta genalis]